MDAINEVDTNITELLMFILLNIISLSINAIPSILIGFSAVVFQFYAIKTWAVLRFFGLAVGFLLIRWTFTIIKRPNMTMQVNASTDHYKLLKSALMVPVVICIYMCDFKGIWFEKLSKTINNGISLMDVGVIGFVFVNAFSKNIPMYSILSKKAIFMFIMGFIRLVVVKRLNYEVEISEYGKHLNFYFILGILEQLHNLYKRIFKLFYLFDTVVGSSLLYCFYRFTSFKVKEIRNNFIEQNIEGLYSIVPLFALFLIVNDFGRKYDKIKWRYFFTLIYFTCFAFLFVCYSVCFKHKNLCIENIKLVFTEKDVSYVSRRATNLGYILWSLFICYFTFLSTFTLCKIYPHAIHHNLLVDYISKNMLLVFLTANLGIILSKFMKYEETINPVKVNLIYLFCVFVLCGGVKNFFTFKKQQKTKRN
ncbi:pigw [Ecytonucleospora hepatopenaei]|uniref:GPI-anchored wall transfer protein n=1 Tax=Ecytonucleospora hepatopenaei TaxID=646526 RepID=A0A1W0E486_9MICR|nr:pigw [Ecytonucleospora hepatopenaei]